MAVRFGTPEWCAALEREINGSSEYRNAAARWGDGFNGNLLFAFEKAVQDVYGFPYVVLRYFNVYGPREQHKGRMASVVWHFFNQYRANGIVRLFDGSGGYAAGEQRRDFVSVADVVKVNWEMVSADGQVAGAGLEFLILGPDGRIRRDYQLIES